MALPLSLAAVAASSATIGAPLATTNIKTTSCCAQHGGCLMADQVLNFPTSVTNPPEFDFKVSGTLPTAFKSGSFTVTGALAGVKVLNQTGKACGTQTIVARETIKLATITIVFPACPDPQGPLVVTGHVSVPLAPPLGTVFKTNIQIHDDATGGLISCLETDVGGGAAPSPGPPAPAPPAQLYQCVGGKCVAGAKGVSIQVCQAAC